VPVAWTIAGSDSGGGAGIQADLKVMNAFGVHGCSVITALTAQNSLVVESVQPVSANMLRAQLEALFIDLPPAAIKTGMLGSTEACSVISEYLSAPGTPCPPLICDPILKSTSGADLLDPEAIDILVSGIVPHATVLTPNLPEASAILQTGILHVEEAAEQMLALGAASVLIKGGHAEGTVCRDYWTDGSESMWLSSPRIDTRSTHGTGCILASAIASALALGQEIPEAVITAKTFLNQCLGSPARVGRGNGPMMIRPFENRPEDRPELDG